MVTWLDSWTTVLLEKAMSIGKDLLTSSKTRNGDFNWKRSGLTSSKTRNGDFNWKRSGLTSKINMFVLFCRASKIGNSLFSFSRAGTMIPSVTSPPQSPLFSRWNITSQHRRKQQNPGLWKTMKNDESDDFPFLMVIVSKKYYRRLEKVATDSRQMPFILVSSKYPTSNFQGAGHELTRGSHPRIS